MELDESKLILYDITIALSGLTALQFFLWEEKPFPKHHQLNGCEF